jgi:phosphoglycerate dehydrogenase-like enzyme
VADRPLVVVLGGGDRDPSPQGAVEDLARFEHVPDPHDLEGVAAGADVVLAWGGRRRLLAQVPTMPRLRWIQSTSAGVEDLADPVLDQRGVVLTNMAGIFDAALAESVLGFLLAFSARILEDARVAPGDWPQDPVRRLAGTTALVVGAGSIGTEVGRLLRAAGLTVRAIARTPRPADEVFEAVAGPDDLVGELALADHVVNALPLTPRTRRVFDVRAFAAMKPEAVFVNIGRGATVDEPALVRALDEGRIAGAALDVFETEPLPPESPLWRMPNVLVSPHRAGDHVGWEADVVGLFVDNLRRFVAGEPLRNVVDVGLGYAPGGRSPEASGEPEA